MDRNLEALRQKAEIWLRELEELARTGKLAIAEVRLAEWYPDDQPDGGVVSGRDRRPRRRGAQGQRQRR